MITCESRSIIINPVPLFTPPEEQSITDTVKDHLPNSLGFKSHEERAFTAIVWEDMRV